MKIYNTLTRKKETFKPLEKNKIKMYVCGPTIYDLGHLGHARSAVAFDIIRKYLKYKGFEVTFVSNYTDIDDKMINRANEKGITVKELADKIIPEYQADYKALNIDAPDIQPKATEYIKKMIEIVEELIKKAAAYELEDGIYFDISAFPEYGKLSKQKVEELQAGTRIEIDEKKKNPHDFVLWKKAKPGEPFWPSPWGDGRPGWHIECSAMNFEILGETIDIHGGGADLIFPHHEDEIAQSECSSGKPFANYWIHNGFIQINKEKMSKSLGNFFTIRDLLDKYPASAIRYLLISTHYRSPIEFNDTLIDQAKNSLKRITDFIINLNNYSSGNIENKADKILKKAESDFEKTMDDDFEVPQALAVIFTLIKEINILIQSNEISNKDKENTLNLLSKFDEVLGILKEKSETLDPETEKLIFERDQARKEKNWQKADEIRDKLLAQSIELEDTPKGTIWKKT